MKEKIKNIQKEPHSYKIGNECDTLNHRSNEVCIKCGKDITEIDVNPDNVEDYIEEQIDILMDDEGLSKNKALETEIYI